MPSPKKLNNSRKPKAYSKTSKKQSTPVETIYSGIFGDNAEMDKIAQQNFPAMKQGDNYQLTTIKKKSKK